VTSMTIRAPGFLSPTLLLTLSSDSLTLLMAPPLRVKPEVC
jgi:hypothetical protein